MNSLKLATPEEKVLEETFGGAYLAYRKRVRRSL